MTIANQSDVNHLKELTNFHPETFPSHVHIVCSDYSLINYLSLVNKNLVDTQSTSIYRVEGKFSTPNILSNQPILFTHAYFEHEGLVYNKGITDILNIGFPDFDIDELHNSGINITHELIGKALNNLTLGSNNGITNVDWLDNPEAYLGMNRIAMFNVLMRAFNISFAQKYGI